MFAFLLIVCTPVHYGVQCLPPQQYKDLATCQAVGTSYRKAGIDANAYYTAGGNTVSTRCVRIAK
jgi:hypothetical protein